MGQGTLMTAISAVVDIIGIGGYIVGGLFVFVGLIDAKSRARRKENDALNDTLIKSLERTVQQQETALKELTVRFEEQSKEFHQLQGANQQLMQILQGRDPEQMKIFNEAPKIFAIAEENNHLSKANSGKLDDILKIISKYN